jgi:hypothetical protein
MRHQIFVYIAPEQGNHRSSLAWIISAKWTLMGLLRTDKCELVSQGESPYTCSSPNLALFCGEMTASLPERTLSAGASSVVGLFVRSKTNRLVVGKVVEVAGDQVIVEYFHSTAHSVREAVAVSQVVRVTLPPQTVDLLFM